jgi:plastocyanin
MPRSGRAARVRRAALLVAVVAGTNLVGTSAQAAPVVIRGHAISWSPANVTIVRGGIVRWRSTHLTHNVYAYGTNWSFGASLPEGSSTRHRFDRRGTYRFRCTLHSTLLNGVCSGMCGSVRVA